MKIKEVEKDNRKTYKKASFYEKHENKILFICSIALIIFFAVMLQFSI